MMFQSGNRRNCADGRLAAMARSCCAGLALLVWVACGSGRQADVPGPGDAPAPSAGEESVTNGEKLDTYQGTLARTVEEGGWLLKTGDQEYLLLGTTVYRGESWFREGAGVQVQGEEAPGAMTIYMQGTPFRVASMKPLEGAPK